MNKTTNRHDAVFQYFEVVLFWHLISPHNQHLSISHFILLSMVFGLDFRGHS